MLATQAGFVMLAAYVHVIFFCDFWWIGSLLKQQSRFMTLLRFSSNFNLSHSGWKSIKNSHNFSNIRDRSLRSEIVTRWYFYKSRKCDILGLVFKHCVYCICWFLMPIKTFLSRPKNLGWIAEVINHMW